MTTHTVTDMASWHTARATAQGGDVIEIAHNTILTGVEIANWHPTVPITIQGDTTSVFESLRVPNSSNLVFSGVSFAALFGADGPTDIYSSRFSNVKTLRFFGVTVQGDVTKPTGWLNGPLFEGFSDVEWADGHFSHVSAGLVFDGGDTLKVEGNSFEFFDKGGIEMGGVSDASILNNSFTNAQTSHGTHGDVIQVFTEGTKASARNIIISGNRFVRGAGTAPQGILIQDETGQFPYQGVITIEGNLMLGAQQNSIRVTGIAGMLDLNTNVVASWAGQWSQGEPTVNFAGGITYEILPGGVLNWSANEAQVYIEEVKVAPNEIKYYNVNGKAEAAGNQLLAHVVDQGAALLAAWQAAHSTGAPNP